MAVIPSAQHVREARVDLPPTPRVPALRSETPAALNRLGRTVAGILEDDRQLARERDAVRIERAVTEAVTEFSGADEAIRGMSASRGEIATELNRRHDETINRIAGQFDDDSVKSHFLRRIETARRTFLVSGFDYAERAGAQHHENTLRGELGGYGAAIMRDPDLAEGFIASGNRAIADAGPTLPRDRSDAVARDWSAKAPEYAIQGLIDRDPEKALRVLARGHFFDGGGLPFDALIPPERQAALKKTAEVEINARRIEAERQRAEADRQAEKAREVARDRLTTGILSPSDKPVTAQDIVRDPALKSTDRVVLMELMEKRTRGVGDEANLGPRFVDTLRKVHAGEITSEDQLQTLVGDGVSFSGFKELRQELLGRRTAEGAVEAELKSQFLKAARAAISGTDPLLGLRDARGEELLTGFHTWFLPEYKRRREAGESPVDLLAPDGPMFQGVARFKRSRAEFMRDLMGDNPRMGGTAPDYKSAAEVQDAYRRGAISRDDATRVLREKGWAQ